MPSWNDVLRTNSGRRTLSPACKRSSIITEIIYLHSTSVCPYIKNHIVKKYDVHFQQITDRLMIARVNTEKLIVALVNKPPGACTCPVYRTKLLRSCGQQILKDASLGLRLGKHGVSPALRSESNTSGVTVEE